MRPPRLAIDAAAGASRLAGGALQGPWQVPAELVRRALRAGARRVDVRCDDGAFSVSDDGAPLDRETAMALARAVHPHTPAALRDAALGAIEAGPHAELRYLAALPGARIAPLSAGAGGVTVAVAGLRWDSEEARAWLRSVGRFAGGRIALDGAPLPQERLASLADEPLAPPRAGRLSLPLSGEDGALWLIEDGIVSAFLVAPSVVPYVALVDLGGSARPAGDGAALREIAAGEAAGLVEQAARLVLRTAGEPLPSDAPRLRRLRQLLLAAARLPRFRSAALHARTYPARVGAETQWLSLVDIAATDVQGADRRVATCTPDTVATSLFLSPRPTLVLEASERARLSQELGLRFRVLSRAERGLERSWRAAAADALARVRTRFTRTAGAAAESGERALLAAVGDGRAALVDGAGAVRFRRGRLLLPRGNPDVRAAARALARDADQAFAAVLALAGTIGGDALRERWRGRASPVDSPDRWRMR